MSPLLGSSLWHPYRVTQHEHSLQSYRCYICYISLPWQNQGKSRQFANTDSKNSSGLRSFLWLQCCVVGWGGGIKHLASKFRIKESKNIFLDLMSGITQQHSVTSLKRRNLGHTAARNLKSHKKKKVSHQEQRRTNISDERQKTFQMKHCRSIKKECHDLSLPGVHVLQLRGMFLTALTHTFTLTWYEPSWVHAINL